MPQQPHVPISFQPDAPVRGGGVGERPADGRILLHRSVPEDLANHPQFSKRLGVIVQQMLSQGRPSITKGCSDAANRGWFRTPLGGGSGMHYYLWWTPQGNAPAKSVAGLPEGTVLVREVRHHDNHRPLAPGGLDEYDPLSVSEIEDPRKSWFDSPWTADQQRFVESDRGVRIVYGNPGSGKTTALWRAVETRAGDSTLYLSWSRALADQARKRFSAFASPSSTIHARDFGAFLGELCGTDPRRQTLAESRKRFHDAFDWWTIRDRMGPWKDKQPLLHAELRAVLFGRAVPGVFDCTSAGRRLSDQAYLDARIKGTGTAAGSALLDVIGRIDWPSWFEDVFPELHAAQKALALLKNGEVPASLRTYDRIVVDEVQDLTLLEIAVVFELCRKLASVRDRAPWLLLAFDEGQTVRPSGFDAKRLNSLLGRVLGKPASFGLEYSARSPQRIAQVVHRASRLLYLQVDKARRPGDQRGVLAAPDIDARVIYVEVADRDGAIELLEQLGDVDDLVVVTPEFAVPDWVPPQSAGAVLLPEVVKGLEYASVCVLDPGRTLQELHRLQGGEDALLHHEHRTAIDRLRVALSRATENLVFLDVGPDAQARALSLEILEDPEWFTGEDLIELVGDADAPPEERVLPRIRDARALVDESPERAWQRVCQALRLLPDPGHEDGDWIDSLVDELWSTVLAVAARRLVDGGTEFREREEVVRVSLQAAAVWGGEDSERVIEQLAAWTKRRKGEPVALLRAALVLDERGRGWLQPALPSISQALLAALRKLSATPSGAELFTGDVDGWLKLIGFVGDAADETQSLRNRAVDTLMKGRSPAKALKVMETDLDAADPLRLAQVLEKLGQPEEAAAHFERAGSSEDALRNWRVAGRWDRAVPLADGEQKADLEWMSEVEDIARRRPPGLETRMTHEEKLHLNRVVAPLRARVSRTRRKEPEQLKIPGTE